MSQSERAAIAQLLQGLADQISSWMKSPKLWEYGGPLSLDTVIHTCPYLLGDRLRAACSDDILRIEKRCVIAGLPAVSEMVQRRFDAAVDYLNAASDFLNMSWPSGAPARDIIPDDICLDYSLSDDTPVWELHSQLLGVAAELQKELNVKDVDGLAAESGQTSDPPSSNRTNGVRGLARADAEIPKEYRHDRQPKGEPHGPLVGDGKSLASAIMKEENRRKGDLRKLHGKRKVFVRETLDHECEAYFRTREEFIKAKLWLEKHPGGTSASETTSANDT